jgi:hypothetical protein
MDMTGDVQGVERDRSSRVGSADVRGGSTGEQTGRRRRFPLLRRDFVHLLCTTGVGVAAVGAGTGQVTAADSGPGEMTAAVDSTEQFKARQQRRQRAYQLRQQAALTNTVKRPFTPHPTNGDEDRYSARFATFSKGLPHDELGEVDRDAYAALVAALEQRESFEVVPLGGRRLLENPEAAHSYSVSGYDPHDVYIGAPPAFDSAEAAAEMVELYWLALLRDVPFAAFDEDPLAATAMAELSGLDGYDRPMQDGQITAQTLFRGGLPGSLRGPYVSQFLYTDVPRGLYRHDQRARVAATGTDYLVDYDDWLANQNGELPLEAERVGDERYLITPRDLATYVHRDVPHQAYLAAALVLLNAGIPLDAGNPYRDSTVQSSFVDFGVIDLTSAVTGVVLAAQHANWYHKWLVHRRLRPEAFGGRLHNHLTGRASYPIHSQLLESVAVARTYEQFGSYLLPQAYPEGAPLHPSFPAGHAGLAGACVTVLKAYFDDDAPFPDPVHPTGDGSALVPYDGTLTVGDELDKLAENMCLGRNCAGIHYWTDALLGLRLGEEVATGWIRDRLQSMGTPGRLSFTSFDGERVTIQP